MKLKTKQELIDSGFIHITTNLVNGVEKWAKFTGYEDFIQQIDFKEGEYTGEIEVITFGKLGLYEKMFKKMMFYPKVNQNGYMEKLSEKWM